MTETTWTYVGPYDAVAIRLPSGWRTIERGESVQLDGADSAAVTDNPHWQAQPVTNEGDAD